MATVRTSLQLYDQFSGVLKGIIQSLDLTVAAMSDVQGAMDKGFDPSTINAARTAIQQTEAALQGLTPPTQQATQETNSLVASVKRLAGAWLSIAAARKVAESTVGGAMEQQRWLDMFIARTGDARIGQAMFEQFKADALATGQDVSESLQSVLSFFSVTQNVEQLEELNKLAQQLAAFDSTGQGIEGAAFALKEALSGDITSLAERFNMSRSMIRAMGIDELGKTGNVEGFIKAMDELLEKQRMGEEAFEQMMSSPAMQVQKLGNMMRSELAGAGTDALQAILPLVTTLEEGFQEGRYDGFFDGLSTALATVTQILLSAVNAALWLGGVITDNWSVIEPIIWGIVTAMTAWWLWSHKQAIVQELLAVKEGLATAMTVAQIAATYGLAEAWQMLNTTMKANVIIAIISALVALGVWLYKTWRTNDEFAAGLMRTWNSVLNFFDQVQIAFARVGVGISNAIQTAKVKTLEIVQSLVNGVIEAINWLIEKVNKIPGISIQAIEQVEFVSRAAAEAEAVRQAGEDIVAQMEAEAAARAAAREQRVQDMLDTRAAERAAAQAEQATQGIDWSALMPSALNLGASNGLDVDSVGKVDEVGRIADTVDISSEDLKIMRELAEMKAIQNFVTLTPTVTVNAGDINNGYDVDTIITRIRAVLEEEIASSAKAVFS